jgi:hypothetical protein
MQQGQDRNMVVAEQKKNAGNLYGDNQLDVGGPFLANGATKQTKTNLQVACKSADAFMPSVCSTSTTMDVPD